MTAVSAPRPGWELLAGQVNQRRYEALRAYLYEGASLQQAAGRTGYTRAALASLVRDLRAGKLTVFAPPGVPGRKSAPRKDAARGRVIELRREGLSVYEISTRLTGKGPRWAAPPSATSCARKDSACCCAAPRPRPAPARPPPAATPGCRPPPSPTSPPCPHAPTPPWPGCCWPSRTWSPSTCPRWSPRPATPGPRRSPPPATCCPCWPSSSPPPGACPTSMTCSPTPPPRCSRGCRSCRRRPRSPTTPTGCRTTTSGRSWPPSTRR